MRTHRQHREAKPPGLLPGLCLAALLLAAPLPSADEPAAKEETGAATWYLLEFADSRPPCADVPPGSRCLGTRPRIARFEMRDGERIEMPASERIPPAWALLNRMWVYAPAVAALDEYRSIELTATPMGARLEISDREHQYLQSIPLGRWLALEGDAAPKLWVRITPR